MVRRQMLALLLCLAAAGCGGSGSGTGTTAPGGTSAPLSEDGPRTLRIAVIPKGTTHDFWMSVHAGAEQAAKELGHVEILWSGPASEKDKEAQINLVNGLIVDQVDGICLAPIDRDALVPPVQRAKQQGIPTLIFDSALADPAATVSYVATDNYKGGAMAGEYMGQLLQGQGNVIMLPYQEGSESTEQRERGFLDAIAKFPEIKILSSDQRVGSDAEEALRISSSLLIAHGDRVNGIFTVCEPLNKGMLKALEDKQLAGKVKFVGFDSDPRFVEALKAGSMHGIVLQDPVKMGYTAVKTLVAHIHGEPVLPQVSTGEYLATRENMDEPAMHTLLFPEQVHE